ncbi:hypothetical protein AAG906_037456 [Vitis piasezkii]
MEARLAKVELAMADTREGLDLIEQGMEKGLEDLREQIQDRREGVLVVRQELSIYKAIVSTWVPKPQGLSGKRDAKELDNFLWHMERYFEAIALTDEATKVRTATLYLTDTTSLWWCRRFADMEKDICTIETWEDFKREIKRQFYPEDVTYLARKNMRRLKHIGLICDYVKEFSSLMLEILNIIEEELLFNFMDNLQEWAEHKLRCRGIQDLATAMEIEESLIDYKMEDSSKVDSLEDSHTTGGEDEVSRDYNALRMGSDKTPNIQEGRVNPKPSTLKTFLLLGVQVNEAKEERVEVARIHMDKVTKGKVNSMGKRKQHSRNRKCKSLHPSEASWENESHLHLAISGKSVEGSRDA